MRYVRLGTLPPKRHIQFRQPDGTLYAEQVFGTRGFSGPASILYHTNLPTQVAACERLSDIRPVAIPEEPLRHRHLKTRTLPALGNTVSGRVPLCFNDDVTISYAQTAEPMPFLFKNADGDELLFVHQGSGRLESMFGTVPYQSGDYLIIPRGTIYRLAEDAVGTRLFIVEARSAIEVPRRYRNEYGQLLEHAPYCERDIHVPETLETRHEPVRHEVRILARGVLNAYYYDYHPFDVVGWDGYVYPWAFSIHDFQPITGLVHQPPPAHQTFEGHNFVVCSFVPRKLDYHPQAVPIPYNHSNVDSDELLYYANDKFGSRRGIEDGSITLHPSGLPHGPQPGAVEASLGKTETEELAVMVDTFRPLHLTPQAIQIEDPRYAFSWQTTK